MSYDILCYLQGLEDQRPYHYQYKDWEEDIQVSGSSSLQSDQPLFEHIDLMRRLQKPPARGERRDGYHTTIYVKKLTKSIHNKSCRME